MRFTSQYCPSNNNEINFSGKNAEIEREYV